jgi:hypothetical protein
MIQPLCLDFKCTNIHFYYTVQKIFQNVTISFQFHRTTSPPSSNYSRTLWFGAAFSPCPLAQLDPAARQAARGFHLQGRQLGAAALQLQRGQALQGPARLLIGSSYGHVIINSCPCRCVAIKRWCVSTNVWEDWQASCGRGRNIQVSMISWLMYVGVCLQVLSVCMDWRNL